VEPTFHYSRAFLESARQLDAGYPSAWVGIVAAREYLRQFGRAAVAPDVRWHIAQSVFGADCGELRWPNPEDQVGHPDLAIRGLFVAHPNDLWYVFTLLGNKAVGAHRGNDWYDHVVEQSDHTARQAVTALNLTPLPAE